MKKLIIFILYSVFFFNASAQQQTTKVEHLKITGGKMIFNKIYYVESQANPFIKLQTGQSFSEGFIEIYAECPTGLLTPDDFLFKISTIGLLLTYKNCQDYYTDFSKEIIFCFNKWEIDESSAIIMAPAFCHSKLNIFIVNNSVKLELFEPNSERHDLVKISETKMSLIDFTKRFSSYKSFKEELGL